VLKAEAIEGKSSRDPGRDMDRSGLLSMFCPFLSLSFGSLGSMFCSAQCCRLNIFCVVTLQMNKMKIWNR
jgi:hypothetical protein